jgi:hypothetical protein
VKGKRNFGAWMLWFAGLASLGFSCRQRERAPADILPPEKMIPVLAQIYTNEEKINRLGVSSDSALKVFTYMKGKIFETNQLTDSLFRRSFDYYMDHPKEMEAVYSALVDTLQLREQRAPVTNNPK